MRETIKKEMEQAAAHHDFNYDKGHKTKKKDDGVVYDYNGVEDDILHSTEYEDVASANGGGKYLKTDEHQCKDGLPMINGRTYTICGAGKTWVKLSGDSNEKFHTQPQSKSGGTKVIVPHNDKIKMSDCELLRQIYREIESIR